MTQPLTPIFDGHNDVLLRLWMKKSANPAKEFLEGDGEGHIDFPRLKAGGFAAGFFAIFAPSISTRTPDDEDLNPPYDPEVPRKQAFQSAVEMAAILKAIETQSNGGARVCLSAKELRECIATNRLGMIFHIEGAEAIGANLEGLEELYRDGLRSIGPVWSRKNIFGEGVPFRFPSSPDTGDGLTAAGKALIRECNRLRMLVDLSHLNEKGFWNVAELSTAPLVATHSNAHALCASSRNLTDDQLRAIGRSGGMVGLNFASGFLRPDGLWTTDTDADVMIRHLEHMVSLAGEDCVGLGSDYDGARIPGFIKDAAGLPRLVEAMRKSGFGEALISKLCSQNWLRVLERTWGA